RLPWRREAAAQPRALGRCHLASARRGRLRRRPGPGLGPRPAPARPPAAGNARGGARRLHGDPARARPRRARRRGNEPLRPPLRAPVAARLAVATSGTRPPAGHTRRAARGRLPRAATRTGIVCNPLRPRSRRPLVPCGTDRDRLRTVHGPRCLRGVAGGGRADDLACDWTVRAVSVCRRAPAARPAPDRRSRHPPRKAGKATQGRGAAADRGGGVIVRRAIRLTGTLLIVAGGLALVWALVVWQWQDPFTGLYTRWQQHKLAARYEKELATYKPVHVAMQQAKESKKPTESKQSKESTS